MNPDWYQELRRHVEQVLADAPASARTEHTSPSGRYRLEVTVHPTGPGTWAHSRGIVQDVATGRTIATIQRNHNTFPFCWAERHPRGHDYLIAGEDYQGQTVVELDTGIRVDHIPDDARQGNGFCWAAHHPSPDGRFLFVDGCFWACDYEIVLFDFRDPLQLPYAELKRWPSGDVLGFSTDGTFTFDSPQETRKSDGVPLDELTEAERDALDGMDYQDAIAVRKVRVMWHPDFTEDVQLPTQ